MQNSFQEIENNSISNLKIKKAYVKKSRKIRRRRRWWKARNYIINPSDWDPFLEIVKKRKEEMVKSFQQPWMHRRSRVKVIRNKKRKKEKKRFDHIISLRLDYCP